MYTVIYNMKQEQYFLFLLQTVLLCNRPENFVNHIWSTAVRIMLKKEL